MENFVSFKINRQEYKDSFQFLSEPLDTLVNALRRSNYDFPNTRTCTCIINSKRGVSIWM